MYLFRTVQTALSFVCTRLAVWSLTALALVPTVCHARLHTRNKVAHSAPARSLRVCSPLCVNAAALFPFGQRSVVRLRVLSVVCSDPCGAVECVELTAAQPPD